MRCKYCKGCCIKNGLQSNGVQRFKCKICHRRQQESYRYNYYKWDKADALICSMLVNGSGIRNISRVLHISTTTVLAKIKFVASTIKENNRFKKNLKVPIQETLPGWNEINFLYERSCWGGVLNIFK